MYDLTYRSPKTEVRESPIQGRGLFAREPIAQGEIVAIKGGYILSKEQWQQLEPVLGWAEIQIAEDLFIAPVSPDHREGSMLFTNHSCRQRRPRLVQGAKRGVPEAHQRVNARLSGHEETVRPLTIDALVDTGAVMNLLPQDVA